MKGTAAIIIILLLVHCKEKKREEVFTFSPTKIIPADCSEEDSIKFAKVDSIKAQREVESKKQTVIKVAEGKNVKSTLDSLAEDVDKYIALRDKSTDSVTWKRWEDSVKRHIAYGQILMNQKVDRIQEVDNTKEFKEGFKVKPKK